MAGHFKEPLHKRIVLMFWDVNSCKTISHSVCGKIGSSIDGPLLPVHNLEGQGRLESSGIILKLDERRWFNVYDESDYEYDEDVNQCERLTTFTTFTSEGKQNGNHVAEHLKALCAVAESGLVFIKNRNYLWSWKGGRTEPKRMGRTEFKNMPSGIELQTFALSKGCLTLSSGCMDFLSVDGHAVRGNDAGSIVLGKKRLCTLIALKLIEILNFRSKVENCSAFALPFVWKIQNREAVFV